jgi:hypothetical protein
MASVEIGGEGNLTAGRGHTAGSGKSSDHTAVNKRRKYEV